MRLNLVSNVLLQVVCACTVLAQDVQKPHEPEYVNAFVFLETDGSLKPLERQTAKPSAKIKALGFGGAQSSYVVTGEQSPVRFSADTTFRFVVRPMSATFPGGAAGGANDVDPATIVQLYRLKVSKGQRTLQIGKAGLFTGSKSNQEESSIPLEILKYGERSVIMRPLKPLPPGEYMWAANAAFVVPQGYCFGVDPAR
jgi:hypothetical protein